MRAQPAARGEIFYHLRSLTDNPALAAVVRAAYPQAALVPASPWLDSVPPDKPKLDHGRKPRRVAFSVGNSGGKLAWLWVLQYRTNGVWATEILPAGQTARTFFNSQPEVVAVSAVDRTGNVSSTGGAQEDPAGARRQSHDSVELIGRQCRASATFMIRLGLRRRPSDCLSE